MDAATKVTDALAVDAAGKEGTIQCFTENSNPRDARMVALAKPSETERRQWYFQRYVKEMQTKGEWALFDRWTIWLRLST